MAKKTAPAAGPTGTEVTKAKAKVPAVRKAAANTLALALISDPSELSKFIATTMTAYSSNGARLHVAIVSAIHHAATFGNPILLDRIYAGLRVNDQQALRLFLRRTAAIGGLLLMNSKDTLEDNLPSDTVQAAVKRGEFITMKAGSFVILNGHTSDQARQAAELMATRFIAPDGDVDHMVLDRDNFAEVRTIADRDILNNIVRLANSLSSTSERRKIAVTSHVRDFLTDMGDKAKIMLNMNLEEA